MRAPKEQDLVQQCLQWLALQPGCLAWRQNQGAMQLGRRFIKFSSLIGVSDILACWRGRFVAIECKRPGEKQRPSQVEFEARVQAAGGLYFVIQSLDELVAALATEELS